MNEHYDAAIHEAGHAVAGMALKRSFAGLWVRNEGGAVEFDDWYWKHPIQGGSCSRVRRGLVVDLAGLVAEGLESFVQDYGELPTPESRAWCREVSLAIGGDGLPVLPSSAFRRTPPERWLEEWEPHDDLGRARAKAQALAYVAAIRATPLEPGNVVFDCPVFLQTFILAEIERAEQRAEAILRERWQDVQDIAWSLSRRKNLRMTYRQVLALLARRQTKKQKAS